MTEAERRLTDENTILRDELNQVHDQVRKLRGEQSLHLTDDILKWAVATYEHRDKPATIVADEIEIKGRTAVFKTNGKLSAIMFDPHYIIRTE